MTGRNRKYQARGLIRGAMKYGLFAFLICVAVAASTVLVQPDIQNVRAAGSSVANDVIGDLAVFSQDYTGMSAVPGNMCLALDSLSGTANGLTLRYDGTSHCVSLNGAAGASGKLLVGGLSPSLSTTITLDMGMVRTAEGATANVYAGGAWLAVRLLDGTPTGDLEIKSNYYTYTNPTLHSVTSVTEDVGFSGSGRFKITIVSNTVTRTNMIYLNDVKKLTTPYTRYRATDMTTVHDPFVNPFVHFDLASISSGQTAGLKLYSIRQTVPEYRYVTPISNPRLISFGVDGPHAWSKVNDGLALLDGGTIWADVTALDSYSSSDMAALKALIAGGFELGIHFSQRLTDLSLADAYALMDDETAEITAMFGESPATWCSLQGADNTAHAEYAYTNLGMVSRNGVNGSAAGLSSIGNLGDNCWDFWSAASAAGIVIPSFSHQLDVTPAITWSISPANFSTYVSNYESHGVQIAGFREYWETAQNSYHTAISDVVSDPGVSLSFKVANTGGKSRLLVNAPWASAVTGSSGASVPYEVSGSGIIIEVESGSYTVAASAVAPSVTTTAATGIGDTAATLNGSLTGLGTASSVDVSFEWGLTASYGSTTTPQTMTDQGAFSAPLSGLAPGTTYHFRAKVVGDSTSHGSDRTFATSAGASSIVFESFTCSPPNPVALGGIYTLTATLRNTGSTAGTATVTFGWISGTTRRAFSPRTATVGADSTVDVVYTSNPTGAAGTYTMYCSVGGVEKTATLVVGSVSGPSVTTTAATGLGNTAATLNGSLTGLGTASSVDVSFEWGLTTGYGSTTTPQTMTGTGGFSAALSGLAPGTTYHFRARAVGDSTSHGSDRTFATSAAAPSIVFESLTCSPSNPVARGGIYTLTATLRNTGSTAGTATVTFGWISGTTHRAFSPRTATVGADSTVDVVYTSNPTSAAGTYTMYCSVGGVEKTVTLVVGSVSGPSVTTTAATVLGNTAATLNGSLTGLGAASSVDVSFEWGLTTAYGNATAAVTMTGTGAFSAALSGLAPGTTYHFRARVVGDSTSYGSDRTFATSAGASSIVLESLTCSPSNPVARGGIYTLTATLRNTGSTAGTATVTFGWISGTTHRALSTKTATVGADSTVDIVYTSNPTSAAGTYTMYCSVGGVETTVTLVVA
jgi:phosphodiesterase/alkaline phosphatase D-like protein